MKPFTRNLLLAATMFFAVTIHPTAQAQGTAFTYQGRLNDSGVPANGNYDLSFSLYNTFSGGDAVVGPLPTVIANVTNGLFTTKLDFGAGIFNGTSYWLQIGVRTNGSGSFTALPRQELTPAPYAVFAASAGTSAALSGALPSGGLSGIYTGPVVFNNPADSFAGNGTGITNVDAVTLNGLTAASFWNTTGNTGASPAGGNFIGTRDEQPLELAVNLQRALRLEPTAIPSAPNVIGGSSGNFVLPGAVGSVIAGGGTLDDNGSIETNALNANYALIGGGVGNTINEGGDYSLITGGFLNLIDSSSGRSAIVGGEQNVISPDNDHAFIGGGSDNVIGDGGSDNTIGGGHENFIDLYYSSSVISGGEENEVSGTSATVSGGDDNQALNTYATVGGGSHNIASGFSSTVSGGGEFFTAGSIAGKAHPNTPTTFGNRATGDLSSIGGGRANLASGEGSTVAGGDNNSARGLDSSIAGGTLNLVTNSSGAIGGGMGNLAGGVASAVSGGLNNVASGNESVVSGGNGNTAGGQTAFVAGGEFNLAAGDYSFAGGSGAQATNEGAFVWADYSTNTSVEDTEVLPFTSSNRNEFAVRATGGARFVTAVDTSSGAVTAGIVLAPGGTSWATISDRNAKKDFAPVNPETILSKLAGVPVEQWHYKWEEADTTPNIGPMAQDFIQAFYPGRNDKSITTLEFDGVELAAIQGLDQKLNEQLQAKDAEIENLKSRLDKLERMMEHQNTQR